MTKCPESLGGCLILPSHQEPSKEWYHIEAPMGRGADRKRVRQTSSVSSRYDPGRWRSPFERAISREAAFIRCC